jgi:hypothetical protein
LADLTIQSIAVSGTTVSFVPASVAGDAFVNEGRTFLYVQNNDDASHTVTINSVTQCDQGFDHDVVVSVAAGVDKMIGPFLPSRFNDTSRKVSVTYDSVDGVIVAAVKI